MKINFFKKPEGELLFSNFDIKRLYIPLLIEQIFTLTVGMVDSIMVASCGEAALSGVSLVDMITNVLINVLAALATGGAIVTAQYIGAKKQEKALKTAWQLVLVVGFISLLITTLALSFKKNMLSLLFGKVESDVMQNALIYFTITAISYPFWGIYNSSAALFRAMGNSKISMKVTVLMNIINIVLNAILIYGYKMGVTGAAIATLTARIIASAIMFLMLADKRNIIYLDFSHFPKPDFGEIKKILYIGIPNGLESSLFQLGRVLVISIVSAFGTAQIAANAAGNHIGNVSILPAHAMTLAILTVVGQCIGAKEYKQVYYYVKKLLTISYLFVLALNIVLWILLPLILRAFNLSNEAREIATALVMLYTSFAIVFWTPAFVLPSALRAANDARVTMMISLFSMITFRISFSYILGLHLGWGVFGVWVAMMIDWVFRTIFFVVRFIRGKWKEKQLI